MTLEDLCVGAYSDLTVCIHSRLLSFCCICAEREEPKYKEQMLFIQ